MYRKYVLLCFNSTGAGSLLPSAITIGIRVDIRFPQAIIRLSLFSALMKSSN